VTLSAAALLGCTPSAPPAPPRAVESVGEIIDDSVITTQVKTALLQEPALKSLQIGVKTFKDVVQLSGFVDSTASRQLAGSVAAAVKGVASVRNDLIVK
jgi:osmotically-inducible protein OsmY